MTRRIEIVEVGPRDGLQNEKTLLSVEEKLDFVRRLEGAGVRRIEAVSFVNPKRVPQMAGAEEVMAGLPHQAGRSRIGLVLNRRGWERAVAARCDEANLVLTCSDTFGIRNQGASRAEQIAALAPIAADAGPGKPSLSVTIAVAFGCPFEGEVPDSAVAEIAEACAAGGVAEIALADTIGVGDPWKVRRLVRLVRRAAPAAKLRLHFHDTRNTGLANAAAAVDEGADILDASVGGIGGCPFAPAATGNIATEDLVYMLARGGFETGLDIAALVDTAEWIGAKLGRPHPSALSRAGVFPKAA
ncbi:MAG: hydroxymethylglutaryl-CoA lyase [Alphaproteobacteria bacterium]|nr:hydroxymethylglutaryl-CoA lyase [Alphaproteobacteria bacterium]